MHFFDIATSKSGPILMCFDILTLRRNGVQFFISHLASWLRTRRFSSGKSCVLVLCWAPAPFFCCIVQLEPLCFQSTRFNSFYLLIPITGPSLRATSAKLEEKISHHSHFVANSNHWFPNSWDTTRWFAMWQMPQHCPTSWRC